MKKQTAVEWYEKQIFNLQIQLEKKEISLGEYAVKRVELFQQAKAMEKEQIIQANLEGQFHADGIKADTVAEQYYNETFKSE